MIRIMAVTTDFKLITNIRLSELVQEEVLWYWVDFNMPTKNESDLLTTHFHFHQLAIEDCLHGLQRPKAEVYKEAVFYVLHALNTENLKPIELDVFINSRYIVTYHDVPLEAIELSWNSVANSQKSWQEGSHHAFYLVLDNLVDRYFPSAYSLEDRIAEIDEMFRIESRRKLLDKLFDARADVQKLQRISVQMSDLLYKMMYTEDGVQNKEKQLYFRDVNDHLLRINDMMDRCQSITTEIRDNYITVNSYRMNRIMMLLTVITTIFIPLTFIVGIYGMNFDFMPELRWHYGYFITLGSMTIIAVGMFLWFKLKGWFDIG